jgi:exopolysaccharide biosynthesis polyprenyl glycosylphosphotransferase
MLKTHARQLHTLILSVDLLLSVAVFIGLLSVAGTLPESGGDLLRLLALGLVAGFAWPLALDQLDLYGSQRRRELLGLLGRLSLAGAGVTGLALGVWALAQPPIPWTLPLVCGAVQLAVLGALRVGVWTVLRALRRRGRNYRNVMIFGTGERAAQVAREIAANPAWGLRVIAYVDDRDTPLDESIPAEQVHKLWDLEELLRDNVVDEALLACPRSMLGSMAPAVAILAEAGVPVTLLSDLFGDLVPPPRVTRFGSMGALSFAPVHHGRVELGLKRLADSLGAAVLGLLVAPIMALAALAIRLTSPGPVFFRQVRSGLNGHPFEMLKLRTMYVDAEARKADLIELNEMDGPVFKIKHDPRITPVGRFLRRFSIDELPQLWNVIVGDMSLVGPRPPLPSEVSRYRNADRRRLSMRPGLTCLWQVNGRNQIGFDDWVRLDIEYIDRWSLAADLRILLRTPKAVIRAKGAS